MEWVKRGLLWAPTGKPEWATSHATLPVVQTLPNDHWRVFFSTRDALGKSRIGRLTVDSGGERPRVIDFDSYPVLSLGAPGTFDDSGVMPSWLVPHGEELRLYYIGWNVRGVVPYHVSIGLAVSCDGGETFRRRFEGPIMERGVQDPYFVTTPCVVQENGLWRMWYASGRGWQLIDGRQEPAYDIRYAESADGISWRPSAGSCLRLDDDVALCRPCVTKSGGRYSMLFSYRRTAAYRTEKAAAYRLGLAESDNGIDWEVVNDPAGLAPSEEGWDSQMVAYCSLLDAAGGTYLFYNGNGFGRSGFGWARQGLP